MSICTDTLINKNEHLQQNREKIQGEGFLRVPHRQPSLGSLHPSDLLQQGHSAAWKSSNKKQGHIVL